MELNLSTSLCNMLGIRCSLNLLLKPLMRFLPSRRHHATSQPKHDNTDGTTGGSMSSEPNPISYPRVRDDAAGSNFFSIFIPFVHRTDEGRQGYRLGFDKYFSSVLGMVGTIHTTQCHTPSYVQRVFSGPGSQRCRMCLRAATYSEVLGAPRSPDAYASSVHC